MALLISLGFISLLSLIGLAITAYGFLEILGARRIWAGTIVIVILGISIWIVTMLKMLI